MRQIGTLLFIAMLGATSGMLFSCSQTSGGPSNLVSLPTNGSRLTYADTSFSLIGNATIPYTEVDTILASGITWQGKSNVVEFGSSTQDYVYFSRLLIDSASGSLGIATKVEDFKGPKYWSLDPSGDIWIPTSQIFHRASDSLGNYTVTEGRLEWASYPFASHHVTYLTNESFPSPTDSIAWSPGASIVIGGQSYACEHVIRVHHFYTNSGEEQPPQQVDTYFSPVLGVPVVIEWRLGVPGGVMQRVAVKHLVSIEK